MGRGEGSIRGHFLSQGAEFGGLEGFWGDFGFGFLLGCVIFKEEILLRTEKEGLRDLNMGEGEEHWDVPNGRVWVLRNDNSDSFEFVRKDIFLWMCI